MFRACLAFAVIALLLSSCDRKKEAIVPSEVHDSPVRSNDLVSRTVLPSGKEDLLTDVLFSEVPASESGLDHVYKLDLGHHLKRLYNSVWACSAVMTGDFNGDGRQDIFFTSAPYENRLYLNEGNWKFREVGQEAGITGGDAFAAGGTVGDVDGDGDLDIYVCNYVSGNQLYLNEGNTDRGVPKFAEVAVAAGVAAKDSCVTASLCDYDRDGDLDLFVLTNRIYRAGGEVGSAAGEMVEGKLRVKDEYTLYYEVANINGIPTVKTTGRRDILFRNDGLNEDGKPKFTDVSAAAGVDFKGYGLSATWWDFNEDGWPDLYVANDYRYPDRVLQNRGDGTFKDVATELLPACPFFSMGSAAADFDNDGRDDMFALDMAATTHYKAKVSMGAITPTNRHVLDHSIPRQNMRNFLYLNSGVGPMREAAFQSKLSSSDWSWTPLAEDFDGDGKVDIIITNGMIRDFTNADAPMVGPDGKPLSPLAEEWLRYENGVAKPEQNLAFKNKGGAHFADVSEKWGLGVESVSFGACWADFDNDGDPDIIMTSFEEPPKLYRNNSAANRVVIKLDDSESANRHGLGARVTIETASGVQTRLLCPANGFLNANEAVVHFGLGEDKVIRALAIEWPGEGDDYQVVENLEAGFRYEIKRDRKAPAKPAKPMKATLFAERPSPFGDLRHHEKFHDDFIQQNLLPWRVSSHGPGHAWGDVDGDGKEDFCVANGAGSVDFVFYSNARKTGRTHQTFKDHQEGETNAVLLFDADGDGDLDLYFARGSYEYKLKAPIQRDLLYLNSGTGLFSPAPESALPANFDVSGHVAACDFDRDGDLDLFVAGKVIPGEYPLAPRSRLLRNDSSNGEVRFTDVGGEVFPGTMTKVPPMVNAAVWSDVDADGWIDLMLAVENGPVRWLRNTGGVFEDRTEASGLAPYSGWWNSIYAADIDHDGDMDYVAGNIGKNTKYNISKKKPALLYYGDLSGSGRRNIVEAKAQKDKDKPLPVRGRF